MLPSTSKLALAFIPLLLVCKAAVALPQSGQSDSIGQITTTCGTDGDCTGPLFKKCCRGIAGGYTLCLTECPSTTPPADA